MFGTTRKKIETLEREVLSNPNPQNMVRLVEALIAAGQEGQALDFAKKAVERFPDSEKCNLVYQNVRRVQLQSQIQELIGHIRKNATASHFEQLATLFLWDLGNRNKAFETAMQGLSKFPSSDGLHLLAGQIRMDRFHHDFVAKDFNEAIRHFNEAVKANPQCQKAFMNVGRLYAEVGAYTDSVEWLDRALEIDPNSAEIEQLKKIATENAEKSVEFVDEALAEIEKNRALSPKGMEVRKVFEPTPRGGTILEVSPSKIEQFLQGYESINGYKCSAVLSVNGDLVAGHSRGDIDRDRFVRTSQALLSNALESAKKMDTGAFVSSEIETPLGQIALAMWKNLVLSFLAGPPAKKEDIERAKERFVGFAVVQAPSN